MTTRLHNTTRHDRWTHVGDWFDSAAAWVITAGVILAVIVLAALVLVAVTAAALHRLGVGQ